MEHDAEWEILRLHQGGGSVSDYAIEFQTLTTDNSLEGHTLVDSFINGLFERVKDELLTRVLPEELDRIISLAIRIDSWLEDWQRFFRPRSPPRGSRSRS